MALNERSIRKSRLHSSPTRERILEEGVKLFLRKGFSGASVQDITQAVNMSKGALCRHFRSKSELLEIMIRRSEEALLDGLVERLNAGPVY